MEKERQRESKREMEKERQREKRNGEIWKFRQEKGLEKKGRGSVQR